MYLLGASGLRGRALASEDTRPLGCENVPAGLDPGIPVVSHLVRFGRTDAKGSSASRGC